MPSIKSLLKEIETRWQTVASESIVRIVSAQSDKEFYAAAFWLFYVDYTVIHPPCFAMNHEAHVAGNPYGEEIRWSPPNWQFDVIDGSTDVMMPIYTSLSDELAGADDNVWDAIIEEHKQCMARVSLRITSDVLNRIPPFHGLNLPPTFICGIFDEREGEEECNRLAALSIDPVAFTKLGIPYI